MLADHGGLDIAKIEDFRVTRGSFAGAAATRHHLMTSPAG
jgi:hypothetical protein